MLLHVNNISARYGRIEVLRSVSIEVDTGEVIAILGPNGAGKSTTVRAILGLKSLTAGEILFNNQRIDRLPPQSIFAAGISSVPEQRRLFPRMSVVENLLMAADVRKDKEGVKNTFKEIYDLFPILRERRFQQAGTLSGGQQQILAMARAMMAEPKLMVLDEPSLGLAPLVIGTVFETIGHAKKRGIAVLVSEQNARRALQSADRAYILENGSIVLSGSTKDIVNNEMVHSIYLGA